MGIEYEYPLPQISVNIDRINDDVCFNSIIKNKFNIKNISGSVLSGKISTNIPDLKFTPDSWCENTHDIVYIYDSQYCSVGTSVTGRAVIESNGGEVVIPIVFNIVPKEISIYGQKINSLDTFSEYAEKDFLKAKKIFMSEDFLETCNIKDSNLLKLYKRLNLEVYKEIALDNFLIVSGKKESAKIIIDKSKSEFFIKYTENKKIKYKIPLKIVGYGTIEAIISTKLKEKWIELPDTNININNIQNNTAEIFCIIDTNLIKTKVAREVIQISNDNYSTQLEIIIKRENMFDLTLSKNYYDMNDTGSIKFTNNTGEDIMIEIASDKWIKFKSKKYFISTYAEIPFEIKVSKMFDLIKIPLYKTTIAIKTSVKGKLIRKYLDIKIVDSRV